VSEETERAGSGSEGSGAGVDPTAVALAMAGASREEFDAFLRDQRRLVALQTRELSHELDLRHWSLWVRYLSGVLKLTFEIGLAVAALGLACFIGAAVWNAAHAEGLVIEPFSVPPDLAARGITGQFVASQMLDRLNFLQKHTESSRPGRSYVNSWGNDLKVEIPDTGISLGEAYRFMRRWLGRETHVSGEVIRTPAGIVISARTDGSSVAAFKGSESDLDLLIGQSAEQIYSITQPDRYARYLIFPRAGLARPRFGDARAVLNQMADNGVPSDKPWAWFGLAILARYQKDYSTAHTAYQNAIIDNPSIALPMSGLAETEVELGHPEIALADAQKAEPLLDRDSVDQVNPNFVAPARTRNRSTIAFLKGDYQRAAELARAGAQVAHPTSLAGHWTFEDLAIRDASLLHDEKGLRAYWTILAPPDAQVDKEQRMVVNLLARGELGQFQAVIASAPEVEQSASSLGESFIVRDTFERQLHPMLALAKAKTGDLAGARALIEASPLDCYDCVRIRGLIAEEAGQPALADQWFARAVHDAPSIPRAYANWGTALLGRGQPDAAIEKFKLANQKGPHFADPLEGWGEALMAKNQSHLALAKFAQAEKYAPNWGRLHLKWGEALYYAGKRDEAQKQIARAAALDLTPTEKAELSRFPVHPV
jgi:tetratricopeptide (TPR) repeat protein